MTALTLKELVSTKAAAAGIDQDLAVQIAYCESTLRQFGDSGKALRGIHNPNDVGIFQINENFHSKRSQALGFDIYTTEGNIDYALYLLEKEGAKPWNSSRACWSKNVA